jgi:hypothetical protein
MSVLESLRAANIQQHKPGRARSQRRVNVPAVGFERQELLKVIKDRLRIGDGLIVNVHAPLLLDLKTLSIGRNANMR